MHTTSFHFFHAFCKRLDVRDGEHVTHEAPHSGIWYYSNPRKSVIQLPGEGLPGGVEVREDHGPLYPLPRQVVCKLVNTSPGVQNDYPVHAQLPKALFILSPFYNNDAVGALVY